MSGRFNPAIANGRLGPGGFFTGTILFFRSYGNAIFGKQLEGPTLIETERLILRKPNLSDVPCLFEFLGDPVAMQYTHR